MSPLSCKYWKFCEKFLRFFWQNDSWGKIFKILLRKFLPPHHRSTLLCSNVVEFDRREIGEIVRCLPDQKKFGCLSNRRYCTDRPLNSVITVLQISSKLVHFRQSYSQTRFFAQLSIFIMNNEIVNAIWHLMSFCCSLLLCPSMGIKYCDQHVCVCLSVCLSVPLFIHII